MIERICLWLMLAGVGLVLAPAAHAQGTSGVEQSGTSYHAFVRPGEVTVEVLVLGAGSDGLYEVGLDTRLDQLLALSGGALMTKEAQDETTIRLFRQEGGQRTLIYESSLERMLLEPGQYPALQDGDVFVVERPEEDSGGFTWRDGISLVSSIASLTLIILRYF